MNCFPFCLYFSLFLLLSFQTEAKAPQVQNNGIYIVYMGAVASSAARRNDHDQLIGSLIRSKKNAVVHSYNNGFAGFAARLSAEEARSIAQRPGVVSVFPDPILQLHTTRSWDFLEHQTDVGINARPISDSSSNGADTIIGILDTGIWPESKSFDDKDMGPIPARWKGACMKGLNFTASNCNKKLIGARYYEDPDPSQKAFGSPRDQEGHGTHVASTAAGSPVEGASYHGLAEGIARGGSRGSRIAMYRVCTLTGCQGSAILKAFDDAIADGVDVLSLSLGPLSGFVPDFSTDPIAIGAFHAVEKGIMVAGSAGNEGPAPGSVVNIAPWILTVAATTIDRQFESDVVLGGNKVIKGGGINFAPIQKSHVYPLISGIMAKDGGADEDLARYCVPDSLDKNKVKGKIVLCDNSDLRFTPSDKSQMLISLGATGVIIIDDDATTSVPANYGSSPSAAVTRKDGDVILTYINSTSKPVATILPTKTVLKYKPAPSIAYFSSRGPTPTTSNINLLKPDIAAPGVNILAAWPGNDAKNQTPIFNVLSGTSMSSPHVAAVAAIVKSQNPTWSPSAIRSAIMTTAIQTNNMKAPITTHSGSPATPYDLGSGEVSTSGPLQPGLIYETETIEYLRFLCNIGYDMTRIKLIASVPDRFTCPSNSRIDLISNMNYPSIAVSNIKKKESKKVTRTVTNVGEDESVYTRIVDAPKGLEVHVTPNKLQFTKRNKKLSFDVTFRLTSTSTTGDIFGSITWTNGKYKVRSPFVVSLS